MKLFEFDVVTWEDWVMLGGAALIILSPIIAFLCLCWSVSWWAIKSIFGG